MTDMLSRPSADTALTVVVERVGAVWSARLPQPYGQDVRARTLPGLYQAVQAVLGGDDPDPADSGSAVRFEYGVSKQ